MKGSAIVMTVVLIGLLSVSSQLLAQATNEITNVSPSSADQGTSGLTVTFTLDSDDPPAPPAGVNPGSVTIGSMSGASVSHSSQYSVTAVFDIGASEPAGAKDCEVVFSLPGGMILTYSVAGGFIVNAPNAPPSITDHPQSRWITNGASFTLSVTATGTEPLDYQWFKDGGELSGETGSSLSIASAAASDAGGYYCVVTNTFGSDTSDTATLSFDMSVKIVEADFPVVDTMQSLCYDDYSDIICPDSDQSYYGQDAQHRGYQARYTVNQVQGTVYDEVTGLTWQITTDTDSDGTIDADDKMSYSEAAAWAATLNAAAYGGHTDWRLPSIKEMYSLMDFRGEDPSGYSGTDTSGLQPFIDDTVFGYGYGDTGADERIIDSQYASTNLYVSSEVEATMFGVNFADGRIKGYGLTIMGSDKTFYVQCVRGNPLYGINDFVDNSDGTITDLATGLMWVQDDNGSAISWSAALDLAKTKNSQNFLGYNDWRVPNAKELQSILDYSRSPYTHGTAAIDPLFHVSSISAEPCSSDFPWFWASTTHADSNGNGANGAYVCFGRSLGFMNNSWVDIHGAGAQRSDRKDGDMSEYTWEDCGYYHATAPQGDAVRSANYVRLVRGGNGPLRVSITNTPMKPTAAEAITFSAVATGGTSPFSFSWDFAGTPGSGESAQVSFSNGIHTVVLTVTDAAGLQSQVSLDVTVSSDTTGITSVGDGQYGTDQALFTRNSGDPDIIHVSFCTACSYDHAQVMFGTIGNYNDYDGVMLAEASAEGQDSFSSASENIWFNILWVRDDTAGHPGTGFDGSSEIERTWTDNAQANDHSTLSCPIN